MNIAHLLLGSAREFRDLPALARGEAPHLSYRELWRKVSVMSMHLSGRFGLSRGDRVAFAMTNCVEAIEVMYAVWHAGLCAVPMNAKLHAKEFAFILENSGAKLCFVTSDLALDHRRSRAGGAGAEGDRRRLDALLRLHGGR
jgi:acyl-CoA synthetase (AMP-forming)/AMP-acid ligase II